MDRLLILLLMVISVPGCIGNKAPVFVDVSGTITSYGEPLEGAAVMFVPEQSRDLQLRMTPIAFGVTDENGHYQLSLANGSSGAVVGKHRVFVSKLDLPEMMRFAEDEVNEDNPVGEEGAPSGKFSELEKKRALQRAYDKVNPFPSSQPLGEQVFDSFNLNSKLRFDVSVGGASNADFEVGRDPLLVDD